MTPIHSLRKGLGKTNDCQSKGYAVIVKREACKTIQMFTRFFRILFQSDDLESRMNTGKCVFFYRCRTRNIGFTKIRTVFNGKGFYLARSCWHNESFQLGKICQDILFQLAEIFELNDSS